ncbi:MAG: 23S rRNA (guanosine(2251)-2'-O)-methyltransferase RlmB [Spirochaetales bacterium]|nr:23S rRNA (guanosine(2251)-2'-O)-methyltransferase RlmB [Spirochaetales bacterium]
MRIIIGFHAIEEILKRKYPGAELYLHKKSHKRNEQLEKLALAQQTVVRAVSEKELDSLSEGRNHRGAALLVPGGKTIPKSLDFKAFLETGKKADNALVVALDGVTDPQNLGAVMRSADLFSIDLLLLPERRSAQVNQTVLKVSSGAAEYVPYTIVPNLVRSLELLKEQGFWVFGADMNGEDISSVNMTGKTVIVLGAEGKGLSRLVLETCDRVVSIPTTGHIDSLNISVAAGIVMYEIQRQQKGV